MEINRASIMASATDRQLASPDPGDRGEQAGRGGGVKGHGGYVGRHTGNMVSHILCAPPVARC